MGGVLEKFADVSQRSPRMYKLSLKGDSVELRRPGLLRMQTDTIFQMGTWSVPGTGL